MSRFGWAYVSDVITGSVANGPTNSVQFNSGSQILSGTESFIFDPTTSTLTLTGTLVVDGTLFATEYQTTVVSSSIIYSSGSTKFGDDASDTHEFTGSILGDVVSGTVAQFTTITGSTITSNLITGSSLIISASVISASTYLGITGGGGSTTPGGSDKSIQFNSGSTFSGSSNFTYDYTTSNVSLTGALLMSGTSYISEVDYIDFDTSISIPSYRDGRLYYDTDTFDLAYYTPVTNVKVQIGQQTVLRVKNSSGATINKGKLVHITGGVGNNPLINTASWDNDANSANTLGMVMANINHNDFGYVILEGILTGLNTDPATFTAGQLVYLSSSGDYTATAPVAPKHSVRLGEVVRAHATVGSIFVRIDNGYEIDELHNVLISTPLDGDLLAYNATSSVWQNTKTLSGSYTITNTITATSASFLDYVQLGTSVSDEAYFNASLKTNIQPAATNDVDLGGSFRYWRTGYITTLSSSAVSSSVTIQTGEVKAASAIINGNLSSSATVFAAGIQSTGAGQFGGPVTVTGTVSSSLGFQTAGVSTFGNDVTINGTTTLKNGAFVTGTLTVTGGAVTVFGTISGSSLLGIGSSITEILGTNVNGVGNDNTLQYKDPSTGTLTGSANLTYDNTSTTLYVTGTINATSFIGDGTNLTNVAFPLYTRKTFQAYYEPNGANINMYPAHVNGGGSLLTPLRTNTGGGSIQGNGAASIINGVSYGDFKTGTTTDTADNGATFIYWNTGASENFLTASQDPIFKTRLRTDANVSNMGIYTGFRIAQGSAYGAGTTVFINSSGSEHLAALWYVTSSTTSTNGNWQLLVRSGSSLTETRVDTGVVVATNTVYDISIQWTTSSVIATINNTTVSSSTNLPIGFTSPVVSVATLENAEKILHFGGYSVSYN